MSDEKPTRAERIERDLRDHVEQHLNDLLFTAENLVEAGDVTAEEVATAFARIEVDLGAEWRRWLIEGEPQ